MNSSCVENQLPSKAISASCRSCDRLAEIEGELVCFRKGRITKLLPVSETTGTVTKLNLLCEGWQQQSQLARAF
ncbi:hypothetical protein L2680_07465 [Shewanella gelidii]|nr:hypothetical protein [Shewanella gelidii]MCL1097814.1 hypothetical protein [Shewanella gelidii]